MKEAVRPKNGYTEKSSPKNKYYGWYGMPGRIDETIPYLKEELEEFHETFQKGILMTEFGADVSCLHR